MGQQILHGMKWLHHQNILHGHVKLHNLMVFRGPHTPLIQIGDLGSGVPLGTIGEDEARNIEGCITTYSTAAPKMLVVGQVGKPAQTPAAGISTPLLL